MRSQPFLQWMSQNYPPANAQFVAGTPNFRGGWEGWLQVEIARTFLANANTICERELPYPDGNGAYVSYAGGVANGGQPIGNAARCDFYLQRPGNGIGLVDPTYLELKCSNALRANPVQDAWARFDADITKIAAITAVNPVLNCIALLAYWGTLDPNNVNNQGGPNGHPVSWYWGGNRQAYMWDTSVWPAQVTTLQAAQQAVQGVLQANRLLIIAVSP